MKAIIAEKIRKELRKLRGRNLFRGREDYYPQQGLFRIEVELRGEGTLRSEVVIHLMDLEQELWAEILPGGEKLMLKAFEDKMDQFLMAILERCRGEKPYLKTRSKIADYRKPQTNDGNGNTD